MKNLLGCTFAAVMIVGSNAAFGQSALSPEAIMQRLDALDKRNAKLESENAALRQRMRILEEGKHKVAADAPKPIASTVNAQPKEISSAMAMMPKTYANSAYKAPTILQTYNWGGFYVGANAGGGLSDKQWSDPTLNPTELGSHKATGWLGGLQAGYNWQAGNVVFGFEGTYDFADLRGDHQNITAAGLGAPNVPQIGTLTDRYSTRINGLATLAGRIGLASDPMDRTLFYAKGGAAYARESYSQASNAVVTLFGGGAPQIITLTGLRTASDDRWGWMAGLGLEHGLTENWSAKIEYDYLDFGTKSVLMSGTGCISSNGASACNPITSNPNVRQNAQLLTLGINYRFNGSTLTAKY